jgi:hypothetical protein
VQAENSAAIPGFSPQTSSSSPATSARSSSETLSSASSSRRSSSNSVSSATAPGSKQSVFGFQILDQDVVVLLGDGRAQMTAGGHLATDGFDVHDLARVGADDRGFVQVVEALAGGRADALRAPFCFGHGNPFSAGGSQESSRLPQAERGDCQRLLCAARNGYARARFQGDSMAVLPGLAACRGASEALGPCAALFAAGVAAGRQGHAVDAAAGPRGRGDWPSCRA